MDQMARIRMGGRSYSHQAQRESVLRDASMNQELKGVSGTERVCVSLIWKRFHLAATEQVGKTTHVGCFPRARQKVQVRLLLST